MRKKLFIVLVVVVLSVLAVLTAASFYMTDYALGVTPGTRDVKAQWNDTFKDDPLMRQWIDSIKNAGALKDTFMVMPGGERHHAIFVRAPMACGRTAVLVHGYHGSAVLMLPIASIYYRMGYNILLPDLHAHGLSDGDNVHMGWFDRLDVMRWMAAAERMFRVSGHRSEMVVHGVSMGAATTMCISGERQPDYVKCFVEDCGYTSAWDEFACQMKEQFGLSPFPLLYTSSALCKLRYGWSFSEASPLKQVAKSTLPMLFIHGAKDDFVPTWMVYPLFKAKTKPVDKTGKVEKELWIVPETGHARSFKNHPEEYAKRVRTFVSRYMQAG